MMHLHYGTESAADVQHRIDEARAEHAKLVKNEYGIGMLADSIDALLVLDGELAARTALEQITKQEDEAGKTADEIEARLQISLGSLLLHGSSSTHARARARYEGIRRAVEDYRWSIQNHRAVRGMGRN